MAILQDITSVSSIKMPTFIAAAELENPQYTSSSVELPKDDSLGLQGPPLTLYPFYWAPPKVRFS
jgi:hypothetical protein